MHFKIHRGTQEIGGSCVEVWTDTTRIVLDIGMPLVEKDGSQFDFGKYQGLSIRELIALGILPNIQGYYFDADSLVDGVLISHAHIDHYGFSSFLHPDIQYYMGEPTHRIIELTSIFSPQKNTIKNVTYFDKSKSFNIGNITITPYWMDHSAFDAYAFLIEAHGKSLFYSGDFRSHGRKKRAFEWFTHNAPSNVDYLLLEGTQIGRGIDKNRSEQDIENELIEVFDNTDNINLICASGQNIDRLVSIYRACKRTGRTFVVDVYIAYVLKKLSQFAAIPFPSKQYPDIKVIYPYYLCKRLTRENNTKILYKFRHHKITKEEISLLKNKIVMLIRPSMKFDLEHIPSIEGGNLIYSLWEGYLSYKYTSEFIKYLSGKGFELLKIHTSGHADIDALNLLVNAINPKKIVPIHTFQGQEYHHYFNHPIQEISDGQEILI